CTGDRPMPPHQGVAGLALHHFTRREAVGLLRGCGFRVVEVRLVSTRPDGRLPWPWWFGWLRAYGYLIAAERPALAPLSRGGRGGGGWGGERSRRRPHPVLRHQEGAQVDEDLRTQGAPAGVGVQVLARRAEDDRDAQVVLAQRVGAQQA